LREHRSGGREALARWNDAKPAPNVPFGRTNASPVGVGPYDAGVRCPPTPARRLVVESCGRFADHEFALWWNALKHRPHAFFRRSSGGPKDVARWSYLASDPTEILSSDTGRARASKDPFAALARRWPTRVSREGPALPFSGGFAGFLGYEARSAVETSPAPRPAPDGFPTYWLGRYDAVAAVDHDGGRMYHGGGGPTKREARAAIARLLARAFAAWAGGSTASSAPAAPRGRTPRPVVSAATYRRRVAEVRRRIGRGDLFQANVSQRFEGTWTGSAPDLFDRLTAASPTPFSTYLDLGRGRSVHSTSPERFLEARGDHLETRPMKGTRRRGTTKGADRRFAGDLRDSEKDRAELAMIVDLARNDLSHTCTPGSVRVLAPRRLERYASVHQAIGIVEGRLSNGVHRTEAIRRAFPPGSVTGAPKVEAMKVIDALEGEARGPYCGAIGWFDEGGDFDLAVAIRTACLAKGRVSYRVGGGVTWLSDPEAERVETLDKGAALSRAIAGAAAPARRPAVPARRRATRVRTRAGDGVGRRGARA